MGLLNKLLGPPNKEKFAVLFIAALKDAGDKRKIKLDKSEFRLTFSENNEERGVLNLSNLYFEYCNVEGGKAERKRCLKEMVRAALSHLKEMPSDFADASYDIRPRLWTRSTFEQLRLRQQIENGEPIDWPLEPIGEHLYLSLVYDLPESVRSISNEDLLKWGVTFWEAREVAVSNLAESKFVYASVGDELYASNTGDSYDATRLILTELIEEFKIEGRPIAMVPNRDTLLVTGSESEVGQTMMLEFALQQLTDQPRPMISTPLTIGADGQWCDWIPEADNPLHDDYRRLKLGWLQIEYADQKQLLQRLYEIQMNDDVIASFSVMESNKGLSSYCLWNPGVKSILPKTELVLFVDEESHEAKSVSWETVQEHVGYMMEPLDVYPPRYRVLNFPDQNELEKMLAM